MEIKLKHINELHIYDQLISSSNCNNTVNYFIKNFHEETNTLDDKTSILNFLIQSGHTKKAFNLLREWPNKEKYFPWSVFFECLIRKNLKLNDEEQEYLSNIVMLQDYPLQASESYLKISKLFRSSISKNADSLSYQSNQSLKLLWDKLDFIKEKNLNDQEFDLLNQLKLYDGQSQQLADHLNKFNKKQALNILNKQNNDSIKFDLATYSDLSLNDKEVIICQNIFSHLEENIADGDGQYYLFSILFHQMNAYDFALQCLEKCTSTMETIWLKIELLNLNRRYFECIDLCHKVFLENPENPEIQFASLYLKAQSLWEIGSKNEACEIMRTLIKMRPNYRSSYEIFNSWKESL